jgi:hypothetical protein
MNTFGGAYFKYRVAKHTQAPPQIAPMDKSLTKI